MVTEILYVTRDVAWLPWAVQYFFLIGLSVCLFALSLPGLALGRPGWDKPSRLALLGALACGATAPVALLADLHQPGRFLNFYLHPQVGSWMSWGAFFIPLYLGGLFLYAYAALRPALRPVLGRFRGESWPLMLRAGAALAVLGGALVMLYTGAEVMVVRARPLWHTPFLPVQFLVTALVGALGLLLVLNRTVGDCDMAVETRLNRLMAWSLAAVMGVGGLWLLAGLSGLFPSHARALAEVSGSAAWRLTALWAAASALVPLALAVRWPAGSGWATGLIALHSAWMFRWTVFIGGQEVPKTGAGFYHYRLPLGPEGLTGILGTAGLWLFVLLALTALVSWSPAPRHSSVEGV
jgi:tetrathionate reductase subunit C